MNTKETQEEELLPKKKSLPRRIVKWFLWFLGGLLAFVLLAVLTLPLWINPVGTSLASMLVPKFTDTAFNIDRLNLNPYTGKLLVSGVKLANPDGYAEGDAFSLGSLSADVEVASLLSDTIHVREVTVDAPFASYVFDAAGSNNIDRIIAAVNEKLGPKKEKKEEKTETKVVVDRVTVKNVRVVVSTGVFELQSLTLSDFGKETPAKLEISGVKLVNPPGFEAANAFSLGSLTVGVETGDLGKLPLKVQSVVVDSPYASYVFDEKGVDNITRLLEPLLAQGGAAKPTEPKKDAKKEEKKPAGVSGAPVTLDRLEVRNFKAQVCKGRFELAALVVTDFGKPTKTLVRLEGVKLVNPDGFKQPNAFSLGSLSVGLDTADLSKAPIALHDITLKSLYAGYVFNDAGDSNIDVMLKPLMDAGKKGGEKGEVAGPDKAQVAAKKEEAGKGGLPVVVDKVALEDVRADVGAGKFELQALTLSDVGKATPAKLEISGVKLENPPGFETTNAFSLGSLSVGVETGDLGKLPIRVRSVVVDSPYASYVFDEKGVDNITRMLEPLLAQGGAAKPKAEAKGAVQKEEKKPAGPLPSPVTLDRLEVRNLKTQACKGRFEFASLVVTDLGTTNTLVRLEDAKLVHPPQDGFHEPNSFALKSLDVGIETDDLSKKPIVFHDIIVGSPYAGLFLNKNWDHNFKVMFGPLMDGGKKEKKEEKVTADEKKDEEEKKDDDSSRVVIDTLEIKGLWLQLLRLPIKQPDIFPIKFTDIGKQSENGATVKEVAEKVGDRVMEIVPAPVAGFVKKCYGCLANPHGNMKDIFDVDAMKVLGGASDFLTAGATNVLGGAKDFVSGGTTNVLGGAKDVVSGGTTNLLGGAKDFVSGGATNLLGGATEKLGSAVNATKGLIGGLLPGGDKKDDAKKKEDEKSEAKKSEDGKSVDKKDGEAKKE